MAVRNKSTQPVDSSRPGIVVNNINIRPANRSRADINVWRSAMVSAETNVTGTRVAIYDLYEDCLLDPVLSSLIDKRLMAITNTRLRFVRDGEDVPELLPILRSNEFKNALKEVLKSKMWGITLIENTFAPQYGIYNIPRKHIRTRKGVIAYEQYSDIGFSYREGMFLNTMVEVGDADDLGLLLKAVPYVLYKRGCMGDWSQFSEIFGMPMRIGRYDGFDDATRIALDNALEKAGSALSMSIPKNAEIEVIESKSTAQSSDLYKSLINVCDEQLSILILGQTETTKSSQSSGYAQSKTHAETEDDINKDDREFLLSILETKFRHVFTQAGLPMENGVWMFESDQEHISLSERVVIDTTLKNAGLPIDDDYFYEKYNIPKPANYNKLKKQPATPEAPQRLALSADEDLLQKLRDFFG